MIVFDCTRQSTFDAVLTWKNDLDSKVLLPNGEPVPCLLLSNKVCFLRRSYLFLEVVFSVWIEIESRKCALCTVYCTLYTV